MSHILKRFLNAALAIAGFAAGYTLAIGLFDGETVFLHGGLIKGPVVGLALAALAVFLVWRYAPLRPAVGYAATGRSAWGAWVSPALSAFKLILVGVLAGAFTVSTFNPVRVEPQTLVLLDPGKKGYEPMFDEAFLRALVQVHDDNSGRVRFDNERIDALVRAAAANGSNIPALAGKLWREMAELTPVTQRLREAESRFRGRVLEQLVVVSAGNPTQEVSPWPIPRVRCRWIPVWPDRTPQGGDKERVLPISYVVASDPAVRNFVTLTINDPKQTPPQLVLTIDRTPAATITRTPAGRYLHNYTYHVELQPGDRIVDAKLADQPGLGRKLPAVDFLREPTGRLRRAGCQVRVTADDALDPLFAWPVLGQPPPFNPVVRVAADDAPDVRWLVGPVPDAAQTASPGPVVEIVIGKATGKAEWRLDRTSDYEGTPLREVFPASGVEGWYDIGAGLPQDGKALVRMTNGRETGAAVMLVRDDPRWVTVVMPPSDLWAGSPSASTWLSDDKRQALSQLLMAASSLAIRRGAGHPPVRADSFMPREGDAVRPMEDGPIRPSAGVWRQLANGFAGDFDDRPAETPANSIKAESHRLAFVALTGLCLATLLGCALERLLDTRRKTPAPSTR